MKQLKELFSDTIIYGISSVLARFIGYLLVPLHTGMFQREEYAVVSLVFSAIALFNVFFSLGMESSYIRYGKNRESARSLFKTLQFFLLATSIGFLLIVWLFKPILIPKLGLESQTNIYLMMMGILLFDNLTIVPFAELRLVQKAMLFAILRTANVLVNLGLNIYLIIVLKMGVEAVFISNLVASIFTAITVWLATFKMWKGVWNSEILKKSLKFGLPFVPAGIGYVINEMIDRFYLLEIPHETLISIYGADFTPQDLVGAYSACYKLAVFMLLLVQMYQMAWQPFFMRKSDDKEAPEIFAASFKYFNLAAAGIFLFVSLFSEQIVGLKIPFTNFSLVGTEYWIALPIVPVLLTAYWFQGWYINFSAGIFIAEKTKELAKITLIGAVVTLLMNFLLVPKFGMMGSAFATLSSYFTMAILIYRYSVKSFKVPYNMILSFGIIVISAVAVLLKPYLNNVVSSDLILSALLLIATLAVVTIMTLGVDFVKSRLGLKG